MQSLVSSGKPPLETFLDWAGRHPRSMAQKERCLQLIEHCIALIDERLAEQVNAVMHHPQFQRLEGAWRGLSFLVDQAEASREMLEDQSPQGRLVIRVLNVSKRELTKDLSNAIEFDQSQTFKKVYEEHFGSPGGEPFGLLVGDYTFSNHPDDLDLLKGISGVAAAAFAPFVAAASPELLGLDDVASLEQPIDLTAQFSQPDYVSWRSFRDSDDARFVALTLPRMILRRPHEDSGSKPPRFPFREDVHAGDRGGWLWGNSAFAFASVVSRAYAASGWLADVRGVHRGADGPGGGLVGGLPAVGFGTDAWGVAPKQCTEVSIDDTKEKELSELGLISFCDCKDNGSAAFFAVPSVHSPKRYDDPVATSNAKMMSMLQYTLCASRFAHYLKVLARYKVGAFSNADELQDFLNLWLMKYVTPDAKASPEIKARFPLRVAEAEVTEVLGRAGNYRIILRLCPHYQLDQLHATIRLVAQFSTAAAGDSR